MLQNRLKYSENILEIFAISQWDIHRANRIGGVIVSVLASGEVEHGLEP